MPKHRLVYQSPICLSSNDHNISIEQLLRIVGENSQAEFDSETKNYYPQNEIILSTNGRRYRLHEYHFHRPGEHIIDGRKYPAEVHYLFVELFSNGTIRSGRRDVCGGRCHTDENYFVIGRVISNSELPAPDLKNFPVRTPSIYFEYDGSLTTPPFDTAIRWAVGKNKIHLNLNSLTEVNSKGSRPIQNTNGRIILLANNTCNN